MGESSDTRLTVRLDPDLDEAIENESKQGPYNVPKSEVVRAALEEYFSERQKCPPA